MNNKKVQELLASINKATAELEKEVLTATQGTTDKAGTKASKATDNEAEGSDSDVKTREELEAMGYNDLKAYAKSIGITAVGKKPDLIEAILGEAGEEAGDEGGEDYAETLATYEMDELKDIAKEMSVTVKKGMKKDALVKALCEDTEALETALEALGYIDEAGDDLASKLGEMELEQLASICDGNGLSKKGKKQALIDRILEAVESGDLDADAVLEGGEAGDEEEGEEGYTEEEIRAMSADELKELATENDIEIPTKKVKGKSVVDKEALIEAVLEFINEDDEEAGDEGEEGYTEEDINNMEEAELIELATENDIEVPTKKVKKGGKQVSVTDVVKLREAIIEFINEDEEGEDFEASEERLEAEGVIEKEVRAKIKKGTIKEATMKKELTAYYEGDPDCKDCKGCSKEELAECYVEMKQALVDDEGEVHPAEEYYTRNGVGFCCGRATGETDKEGIEMCSICGTEWDLN